MDVHLMQGLVGRSIPTSPKAATLNAYRKHSLKERLYPAIVPDEKGAVTGLVYEGLNEGDLDLLDIYEGDEYDRLIVKIEGHEGLEAYAYVLKDVFQHLIK